MLSPFKSLETKNSKTFLGFTIIETLVVLGIGILFAGSIFLILSRYTSTQNLDLAANSIVAMLRDAAQRARGQESSVAWGVRFTNSANGLDSYSLFSGAVFSAATSTYFLSGRLDFSDPASGAIKDIVFTKRTGLPTAAASVSFYITSDVSETRMISVSANGSISF